MQLDPLQKPAVHEMPRMVEWYSPGVFFHSLLQRLAAHFFPPQYDHRLTQASLDRAREIDLLTRYDYSEESRTPLALDSEDGSFWLDHLGDAGDGFLPSYALAYLLSQDQLHGAGADTLAMIEPIRGVPIGTTLPAGQLLLLGGDHAVPSPSRDNYQERLQQPFDLASPDDQAERGVFALPGERDRLDGLLAFDQLFCSSRSRFANQRGRRFGRYHCRQHRSYFAIRLPYNWWIWAPDIPHNRAIDDVQLSYFFEMSRLMGHQDKVVLLIDEPGWLVAETKGPAALQNIAEIVRLFRQQNAKLCAVIASGMNHYSRYKCEELNLNLMTSGGGGHTQATHALPEEINIDWQFQKKGEQQLRTKRLNFSMLRKRAPDELDGRPRPTIEPACYPSAAKSKRLSWKLLAFPFQNWKMSLVAGVVYLVLASIFAQAKRPADEGNGPMTVQSFLEQSISQMKNQSVSLSEPPALMELPALMASAAAHSPALMAALILLFVTLYLYANKDGSLTRRRGLRLFTTAWHFFAHVAAISILYGVFTWLNAAVLGKAMQGLLAPLQNVALSPPSQLTQIPVLSELVTFFKTIGGGIAAKSWLNLLYPLQFMLIGSFVAGAIIGLYLFLNCRFLKINCHEGFTALAIADYKHFLRLRFTRDKLTIYPIALNRVPTDRGWQMSEAWQNWFKAPNTQQPKEPIFTPRKTLKPRLIEGPIEIDARLVLNIPR